jgi:hypothetical protein
MGEGGLMTNDNYKIWIQDDEYVGWLYDSKRNKYYFNDVALRLEEMFMIGHINRERKWVG